jgi:hypothetical protein
MRKIISSAAIAATAFLAVPAWADRDHRDDRATGNEQISTEHMKQKIDALGYDIRRLEVEDGDYEAHLVDQKSGGAVKAVFHGATGELVRAAPHE